MCVGFAFLIDSIRMEGFRMKIRVALFIFSGAIAGRGPIPARPATLPGLSRGAASDAGGGLMWLALI